MFRVEFNSLCNKIIKFNSPFEISQYKEVGMEILFQSEEISNLIKEI